MSAEPTLNIYFGGDHYTHKDLMGNALMAEAIADLSDHRYCSVLPQNYPEGDKTFQHVRDEQLMTLLQCDLALFNFDGSEIDAGAVVEFMTAKFADMPCVILRTDSRGDDDADLHPWARMAQFFPRTEVEVLNSVAIYQNLFSEFPMTDAEDVMIEERSSEVARTMVRVTAQAVVDAFDRALEEPSQLGADAPVVYRWLARFFGPEIDAAVCDRALQAALQRKQQRGLFRPDEHFRVVGQ